MIFIPETYRDGLSINCKLHLKTSDSRFDNIRSVMRGVNTEQKGQYIRL